jgi:hypothetical protein
MKEETWVMALIAATFLYGIFAAGYYLGRQSAMDSCKMYVVSDHGAPSPRWKCPDDVKPWWLK